MKSNEIRKRFLTFFEERGHKIIPSASIIPENDASTLFINSGMQPLVPYLMGEEHPEGTKLANFQKVIRTIDIDEVGDNTHLTFFEMMGNWSLGDYFKEDAIKWSYELLIDKEKGFGLDPNRLYVTCFEGDENAPKDTESAEIWKSVGVPEHRIYFRNADDNWWSPGDNGPCGPDSEMFYDVTEEGLGDLTPEQFQEADDTQKVIEIWNDVFMQYNKKDGKVVGKLEQKNVDTGSGFERIVTVVQNKNNVFDTDLFEDVVKYIKEKTGSEDTRAIRIIADHVRAAMFMIADGVIPSNTDQGYVLRRLIRRARYYYTSIGADDEVLAFLITKILPLYKNSDYDLDEATINSVITEEESKFNITLEVGKKTLEKMIKNKGDITGQDAFLLFSTYGFPLEMTKEIAEESGIKVDEKVFEEEFKKHQNKSRTASEGKFKGGLADKSDEVLRLHTAHHLLLKALQQVLGDHVKQRGSNITGERLRIDFSHGEKMTDEQKAEVEKIVNEKIQEGLPMIRSTMPKEEAEKLNAEHEFGAKYPDTVSIYSLGPVDATEDNPKFDEAFSIEFCGGPHVSNTSELGTFKIKKEEASSAGVRRIKAILE